ncbi:hypothetical protein ACFL5S_00065 [Fibrobacterota bacterium]
MIIRKDQKKHDAMINYIATVLKRAGYIDIKADLPKYKKPDKILWRNTERGDYPDITGFKNGVRNIIEIETEDTLTEEHIREQWILFSRFAAKTNALFYVFVPAGCKRKATQRIMALGISGNTNIIEVFIS